MCGYAPTSPTFDGAWQYYLLTLFQQCLASFSLPCSKFRRLSYKTDDAVVAQTNIAHSVIRQS